MSYEEYIVRLAPRIRAISKKVKGRYIYCDEEDFCQEALLHLWEMYGRGELDGKTDSYLLQGCFFFLKNYIRKICKGVERNSVSMYEGLDEHGTTLEEIIESPSYMEATETVEIFFFLDDDEVGFTGREKDIIYYHMEGYTTREIGEKLGVSHVTVVKVEKRIKEKCSGLREDFRC